MQKISLLVFSRNDIDKALDLIEDMYESVDEILLFDSSSDALHKKLVLKKKAAKLAKLRIFYVVPLGYLEPTLMYAIKKCRYGWSIMMGTDERLSPSLKADLHGIITDADCAAFSIRRYEEVSKTAGRGAYTNWQTRLFRNDRTSFGGLIHEEPKIKGSTKRLGTEDYFIDHVDELKGKAALGYGVMERFLRMSYESFNDRLIDHFYKITVPSRHDAAGSFGGSMNSFLLLYEKLGNKRLGDEISDFDYFVFYYLYSLATNLKVRRPSGIFTSFGEGRMRLGLVKEWQRAPDGDIEFEISKILYKIGLIKFLELDNSKTILKINKKYRNKEAGIGLLIKLLELRYAKGKKWLD